MPFMPHMLFGRGLQELENRIDSGIAANTIRRLIIINATPQLIVLPRVNSAVPRAIDLARGNRTHKARTASCLTQAASLSLAMTAAFTSF